MHKNDINRFNKIISYTEMFYLTPKVAQNLSILDHMDTVGI